MRQSTRLGFSLVEVVIIIAILVVLLALLIPAVMKVREAANRTQSNNNLRQCALGIHNYESTYKKLPHAAFTGGDYKGDAKRSMWFHLLPFVDAKAVYERNAHDAVVPAYLAPSDPSLHNPAGRICFAGNIRLFAYGTLTPTNANNAVGRDCGPSGLTLAANLSAEMTTSLSLARIADGTSNTFMLATRHAECGSPGRTTHYSASPIGTILAEGGETPSVGVPAGNFVGGFFGAGPHNVLADRFSPSATFQIAPKTKDCVADHAVFGHSFSAGGISIALADATVKSVDPQMTTTTFCRALCPGDGCCDPNDWLCD